MLDEALSGDVYVVVMARLVKMCYNEGTLPAHTKRSFQKYELTFHSRKVKSALLFIHKRKYFHSLVSESVGIPTYMPNFASKYENNLEWHQKYIQTK